MSTYLYVYLASLVIFGLLEWRQRYLLRDLRMSNTTTMGQAEADLSKARIYNTCIIALMVANVLYTIYLVKE